MPTLILTPDLVPKPTFTPTPDIAQTPIATPPVSDPQLRSEDVLVLPQPLYEGDRLSIDIDPLLPPNFDWAEDGLSITLTHPDGKTTTAATAVGMAGVPQARLYWLDDPLPIGTSHYTLTLDLPADVVDVDAENNRLVVPLTVFPREALPPPELLARWAFTETSGISLHYLTGSAAERDLSEVLTTTLRAYHAISRQFDAMDAGDETEAQVSDEAALDLYLLDRVVGQGGYASSDWVAISYADRAYAPVSLELLLRHELVHRLDYRIGCDGAPALLREGLAVVMTGGHYRREALQAKAAALYATPYYVPLAELVAGFYTHQHEVGYLESGAMLDYMIQQWGWGIVPQLCRAASSVEGDEVAKWEAALDAVGMEGTATVEQQWLNWLRRAPETPYDVRLLELELKLMEAMREYQLAYDPAAHFLAGILFSPAEAERLDIVADFVRRPRDPEAIALEMLLAMGQEAVTQGDWVMGEMVLTELRMAMAHGFEGTVLAGSALSITREALTHGWEPYRLVLESDDRMRVYLLDRAAWPEQFTLVAYRLQPGGSWTLSDTMWGESSCVPGRCNG